MFSREICVGVNLVEAGTKGECSAAVRLRDLGLGLMEVIATETDPPELVSST